MAQTSSIFQNEKIRPELQAGLEKINFKKPTKSTVFGYSGIFK